MNLSNRDLEARLESCLEEKQRLEQELEKAYKVIEEKEEYIFELEEDISDYKFWRDS